MALKRVFVKGKLRNSSTDPKRIQFLGYSGGAVDLKDYGFDHPVIYNLKTLKVAGQEIPLKYNHRTKVGVTDRVKNTKETIRGSGEISEDNRAARRIEKDPNKYEASMGLDVEESVITFHEKGVRVNNQVFKGPHYIVDGALLDEMTITEEGRDPMTKVHKLSRMELSKIKGKKRQRLARSNSPRSRVDININTRSRPSQRVRNSPSGSGSGSGSDSRSRRSRRSESRSDSRPASHNLSYTKLRRLENRYPDYVDIIYEMVDDGRSLREIHNRVKMEKMQDSLPEPPRIGKSGNVMLEARLCNALMQNSKSEELNAEVVLEKKYGKRVRDQVLDMDEIGLHELMVIGANQAGGRFTGHSDIDDLVEFIGQENQRRIHNTAHSTFSMPNLFKRVTKIVVEEAWKVSGFFAPDMCFTTSHTNMQPEERWRPSGGSMWEGLDNMGRIKHGSFGQESRYLATLDTKAQMLGFNRNMILNDSMGAIQEIIDLYIEGAMIIPDYKLVQHMLANDGNGFWFATQTTTNGQTYAPNSFYSMALTPANLSTLYLAAQKQVINKGRVNWVNMIGDKWYLVVPPELEEAAWEIVRPRKLLKNTQSGSTKEGEDNYWAGKFEVKKFNQLSNATFKSTGNNLPNGTRFFLWPRGTQYAPFAISYLRGRKRPMVRVREAPVDMLGFVIVGVYDIEINDREPSAIIRADSVAAPS